MSQIEFKYKSSNIIIQCNENDKMKDIIDKFLNKVEKIGEDLFYLYNGSQINYELTFKDQANTTDRNEKKMSVVVIDKNENTSRKMEILSNDIICPECKENIVMNIEDFKINLSGCKNRHHINKILLNLFEKTQKIDLCQIICEICRQNNKSDTYDNEFYKCNTCNKNMCLICKMDHDKNHMIINYDDKNYICDKHNEPFNKYCKKCCKDICISCEKEHENHDVLDLKNLFIDENNLSEINKNLKISIDKFNDKINLIKEVFDKMIKLMKTYNELSNTIIENFNRNKRKRNYYKLLNLNNLKRSNENLIETIHKLINDDNINKIYEFSLNNFYSDNGEKFIGDIKNGSKDGKGILFYDKDDDKDRKRYEGNFKNDKKEGKGKLFYNNGNVYIGDFSNDVREGKGIYYFKNGDRYEGDWKNDIREGIGKYIWSNGEKYEGHFKNNIREGKGTYYFINGDKYEGDWINGRKEGNGIFYYNNGNRYESFFKDDKQEGKIIYYYKNGDKYEGDFKNNLREGNGIIYYMNGDIYEGEFKNDKKDGKGKYYIQ